MYYNGSNNRINIIGLHILKIEYWHNFVEIEVK